MASAGLREEEQFLSPAIQVSRNKVHAYSSGISERSPCNFPHMTE